MKQIVEIDPFFCRMWDFHDRLEHHVDELSCKAEIDSVLKHGQLVPALARRIQGDANHQVELIFGARRLFIARHLNKPLLVELRELTDAEAFVAMDIENRQRLDVSPYERGLNYLQCLRSKLFRSQEEIARVLKVSPSQVSRLIKLAQLPTVVVAAFRSPTEICETWALDLTAIMENPESRARVCIRARSIAARSPKPTPRDTMRELICASVGGRKVKAAQRDTVVLSLLGSPLYRIRHRAQSVLLVLPLERLCADRLDQIRSVVATVLEESPVAQSMSKESRASVDLISH